MPDLEHILPHVNASLNAAAAVLLVIGFVLIKRAQREPTRRRALENAHKRTMLACFGVSVAFLACYLYYHLAVLGGSKTFPTDAGAVRYVYLAILASHVVLAAIVPFLAAATIYLGLADRRKAHRRLARITFPIWLYVSVTGVIVYVMLYHLYLPQPVVVRDMATISTGGIATIVPTMNKGRCASMFRLARALGGVHRGEPGTYRGIRSFSRRFRRARRRRGRAGDDLFAARARGRAGFGGGDCAGVARYR